MPSKPIQVRGNETDDSETRGVTHAYVRIPNPTSELTVNLLKYPKSHVIKPCGVINLTPEKTII